MTARYAIYLAPPADSALWRFGCSWLGRDPETGEDLPQPAVAGLTPERLRAITASPRRYGFHATLKPPMRLAEGTSLEALIEALGAFARDRRPFTAPPVVPRSLGGFLAFVPSAPAPDLNALADDCVRAFDRFRMPPSPAELARRLAAGLTARQQALLREWGYPYVLDEFRFHLTLTGRLAEPERSRVLADLSTRTAGLATQPLAVEGVALYVQEHPDAPFTLMRRFPFGR